MSKSVTAGIADFNRANVALEEVILAELDGSKDPGSFGVALALLDSAVHNFDAAIAHLASLKDEMDAKKYQPLPSFANYGTPDKARALARELAGNGLMAAEKINVVVIPQIGHGKGFYAAIPMLDIALVAMRDSAKDLQNRMSEASHVAEDGMVAELLETNAAMNFRADFLRAFNTINSSFSTFAASAAWSTEMWYRSTSAGSLLSAGTVDQKMVG